MREIYFDNSSTTKPSQAVIDIVVKTMTEDFGNPSSLHRKGMDAEAYIRDARRAIAQTMKVSEGEIFFTSGGTESNNWAIIGTALAARRRGKTILTTEMEHPAVSEPLRFLEKEGFTVKKIPVDAAGNLDLGALRALLSPDVILVTTMYVNNEIGAVVPVEETAKLVHRLAPEALYHVDAIQAYGKYRIFPKKLGIDLLSVSGHKLHGPKGTGFLFVREGAHLVPVIYGGGQQKNMRSGTENVPGIAGLGVAAREAYENFEEKQAHLFALRQRMVDGLREFDDVIVHGGAAGTRAAERGEAGSDGAGSAEGAGANPADVPGAPHIVNAAFPGVRSEVLLHALEDRGIYISAGSACSTHKRAGSPTLTAIGAKKQEMASSVRFSFSETNTVEEVDETLAALRELLPLLRRYRAH